MEKQKLIPEKIRNIAQIISRHNLNELDFSMLSSTEREALLLGVADAYFESGDIRRGESAYKFLGKEVPSDRYALAADWFIDTGHPETATILYERLGQEDLPPEKMLRAARYWDSIRNFGEALKWYRRFASSTPTPQPPSDTSKEVEIDKSRYVNFLAQFASEGFV